MIRALARSRSVGLSTGACLDDLLAARVLPRCWDDRAWAVCELPSQMARCGRDLAPDLAWRPYSNSGRPLFVIARAHRFNTGHDGERALDVYFLDGHSVVHCAGVWVFDEYRGWRHLDPDDD